MALFLRNCNSVDLQDAAPKLRQATFIAMRENALHAALQWFSMDFLPISRHLAMAVALERFDTLNICNKTCRTARTFAYLSAAD
ncbi:hypothetical protein ACPWR0_14220 [Pandoraea pneumonica]|uniref:hypothetical protein n=1 Tax=Pandoraea pneumonica TaxID=2508299 RepID=UPI003CF2011F